MCEVISSFHHTDLAQAVGLLINAKYNSYLHHWNFQSNRDCFIQFVSKKKIVL